MFYFLLDCYSYPLEHLKSTSQLQGYFIGLHFALFGHPPKYCSFIHGKSIQTAHFPYHNALFYKSSCVLKHHPTCKACCWTQVRFFVICWKGREGNSICLGYFSFYFFHFSIYFPTIQYTIYNTIYLTHIKTPTCFGTQVPSSGSYYNQGIWTNLLIYVLFKVISLIKT